MPRLIAVAFVATATLTSCQSTPAQTQSERYPLFAAMQAELEPLVVGQPTRTPTIRAHYAETIRNVPGARHDTGTVTAIGLEVAVHVFFPPPGRGATTAPARGTVVLVHGYLAHALQHAPLIEALLREGYTVVAPELPGHGLSAGERGYIESFYDYGDFLRDVLAAVGPDVPHPLHAIGHSTGATAFYEHLRRHGDPFEQVVFVAPLVRSAWYTLSRAGRALSRPFLRKVGTGYNDPLGVPMMPLAWFDALVAWNRASDSFETIERPVLVLQGSDDEVVDWRYNRGFLTSALVPMTYVLYEDAGHVLFRERAVVRSAAISETIQWLSGSGVRSHNF